MTDTLLTGEDNTPTLDPDKDYLQELVGENKKFKTDKDLAKGKYESDLYIKTLEKRLDEMRSDYLKMREDNAARAKLEELVDQLGNHNKQPTSSNAPTLVNEGLKEKSGIDMKEFDSLVDSKLLSYERQKKQTENFDGVKSKLREAWGNNYTSILKDKMVELNLTEEFVNDLAKNHPTVLYKTLELDQRKQESFQAPPRPTQRTDNFAPTGNKRTWSYYQNLKKTNPDLYWNPKTTSQMHLDAQTLGTAFEDGDFHTL